MAAAVVMERPLPSFRHIPAFHYDSPESPPKTTNAQSESKSTSDDSTMATVGVGNVASLTTSHVSTHDDSSCNDTSRLMFHPAITRNQYGGFPEWALDAESVTGSQSGTGSSGFPSWALDTESLASLSRRGSKCSSIGEPFDGGPVAINQEVHGGKPSTSDGSESPKVAEVQDVSNSDECGKTGDEVARDEVGIELPPLLLQDLEEAYDEAVDMALPGGGAPFLWSSMKDAARAAWAGGTDLLRYWEVLPNGAAKVLARLREGAQHRPALALELGMGRGRLAMQIFLSGASVIGVEFASERYHRAVAASERLSHKRPEIFEISKARAATGPRVRLQNIMPGKGGGAIYEARKGDLFNVMSESEMKLATLIILQVQIPKNAREKFRNILLQTSEGCRLLSRLNLKDLWEPGQFFPFKSLGRCRVSTSWAPVRGHDMYLWERISAVVDEDSDEEQLNGSDADED